MNTGFLTAEERARRLCPPAGKLRLVIDSDAKNEVDDQFAIAWALRSPERFDVEAIYAVPFSHGVYRHNLGQLDFPDIEPPAEGMEASYQEIQKLCDLLGERPSGGVFRGAEGYMPGPGQPVASEAVSDLIARGMEGEGLLYVAAIGAATNIASALLLEPQLRERLVVIWLGGQPLYFPYGIEFNLAQDIFAAQHLFSCGVPLVWVPCLTVASQLVLTDSDVREKLLGRSRLGSYLAEIVLEQFPGLEKAVARAAYHRTLLLRGRDDMEEDYLSQFPSRHAAWSRPIWDTAAIAFLKNPGWTQSTRIPSPVLRDDCRWETAPGRHLIRAVNYCQRDLIMGDMLACLNGV